MRSCEWEGCAEPAVRAVRYRRVRHPDEWAARAHYCEAHLMPALAIFAPTWNVVAWAEPLSEPVDQPDPLGVGDGKRPRPRA